MSWFRSSDPSADGAPNPPNYSRIPPQQGSGIPSNPRPPQPQTYQSGYARHEYNPSPAFGGAPSKYEVCPPEESLVLLNKMIVSTQDFAGAPYVQLQSPTGDFLYTTHQHPSMTPGMVGVAKDWRTWSFLKASKDFVTVKPFDINKESEGNPYLGSMTLEVGFHDERRGTDAPFDAEAMEADLRKRFDGLLFQVGQPVLFDAHGKILKCFVKEISTVELLQTGKKPTHPPRFGIMMSKSEVTFTKADGTRLSLKASAKRGPANSIIKPDFNFSDMGIGGLDDEFGHIFRRAFASRIFPPGLVEKLGIQHVKGILLYGPPGTGKTLIARQIGKMLNAREPKIVNGPEILNKFVGQSEENIRKLFGDAEKEYKAKGDDSGLHIIIMDELDAICKQRGSTGGGTGVGDSVVNQLLSKMDGVDQLNNILIIGMTNRLDMIDEALLRPGRLEVHMEISLPDEHGRLQILTIHTSKMRTNGVMDSDVDLKELASETKNFSGAEIGGLVKSATSFAFNRHVKVGTSAGISDDVDKLKVNRADFFSALQEVKPAFGVAEEELQQVIQNGIIHFASHIDTILRDGELYVKQVRESSRTPLVSVLVHGLPGSGKTALAASIAVASGFPFIKLISADNMVGMSEAAKINYLFKTFSDSYKSPMSVIVVDSIERIIDWVPIGPRFSNPVLQALIVLLSKRPPKEHRLLVLATTSNRPMLADMDMSESFAADIRVPPVYSLDSILHVIQDVDLFEKGDPGLLKVEHLLHEAGFAEEGKVNIGIKKLLGLCEMARQDPVDPADKLFSGLLNTMSR